MFRKTYLYNVFIKGNRYTKIILYIIYIELTQLFQFVIVPKVVFTDNRLITFNFQKCKI